MRPLLLYYSSSPADESLRAELEKHLAPLQRESGFVFWHPGLAMPGGDVKKELREQFERASAVLLLISPDYLADSRCYAEMEQALKRHHAGQTVLVPILMRPCNWESLALQQLQPLPRSGKPISIARSRDRAWVEIVSSIREVLSTLLSQPSSVAQVRTNLPPERNHLFIGRQNLMAELYERFKSRQHPAQASVQALTGLGGIGKTQTALEYAYRHLSSYETILFIQAESEASLQQSCTEVARLVGLSPTVAANQHEPSDAVLRWLKQNRDWLLILDNADEPERLASWVLHDGNGDVLVTSRVHDLQSVGVLTPMELPDLDLSESLEFLRRRTGRRQLSEGETAAAMELAVELGGLPLALEQAGAYLLAKQAQISTYLAAYRRQRIKLLEQGRPQFGGYSKSVASTWALNLSAIADDTPLSLDILRIAAFLHPDKIPLNLFEPRVPEDADAGSLPSEFMESLDYFKENPLFLDEILEPLSRYSLIRRNLNDNTFSIHKLMQELIRENLSEEGQLLFVCLGAGLLEEAFPKYIDHKVSATCGKLILHVQCISHFILKKELKLSRAGLLFHQAGIYLMDQHAYRSAKDLFQATIDIIRSIEPGTFIEAKTRFNLFECYRHIHGHSQSLQEFEAIVEDLIRTTGRESPDAALALNNLALRYDNDDPRKESLLIESLEIRKRTLGLTHPEIAQSLNNLGQLYLEKGNLDKAESTYLQALAIREQSLGVSHPLTARNYHHIGRLYQQREQHDEAVLWLSKSLAVFEKEYSPEHLDVAICLTSLGLSYKQMAKIDKAIDVLKRAVVIREKHLDQYEDGAADSVVTLAELYVHKQQTQKAQTLLDKALRTWQKCLGSENFALTGILHKRAWLAMQQGDIYTAKELFTRELRIVENKRGPEHLDIASILSELGNIASAEDNHIEAERLHLRGINIVERVFGPHSLELIMNLNNLALVYFRQNKLEASISTHRRSLSIRELLCGENDLRTATSLHNLGLVYIGMGAQKEAEECLERANRIRQRYLPVHDPEAMGTMHVLGMYYLQNKKLKKAESLLKASLGRAEKYLGDTHPQFLTQLSDQAGAYVSLKLPRKAKPLLERLLSLAKQVPGTDPGIIQHLEEQFANLKRKR